MRKLILVIVLFYFPIIIYGKIKNKRQGLVIKQQIQQYNQYESFMILLSKFISLKKGFFTPKLLKQLVYLKTASDIDLFSINILQLDWDYG